MTDNATGLGLSRGVYSPYIHYACPQLLDTNLLPPFQTLLVPTLPSPPHSTPPFFFVPSPALEVGP